MKTALLIVDVQNDYFPGGKMELHGSIEAGMKIKNILEYFRKENMPVFHVQHISIKPGATFFLPDSQGVKIHENVQPEDGEKVVVKHYPNSFRDTTLHELLKKNEVSRLVIAGMMTHMCIDTTVRAAFDLGYECIVAGDGCATRSLGFDNNIITAEDVQRSFLAALNGTFAKVVKADQIYDLLK